MPVVHQSTIKRARQALVRQQRNRNVVSTVRTALKKVLAAVGEKNVDSASKALKEATSLLSKAASKGVLKPNTVSRRVSRLTMKINALKAEKS
jgi:small subunit ribosomal protein S20